MNALPLVSIIVPALNEEKNIRPLYEALQPVWDAELERYRFELIFTDNHSSDRTFEFAAELAARDCRVRVFRFSRNFGFQQSILTGYRKARGAAVVQIDCDLQDPPSLISDFLRKWEAGYQVVYGIRRRRKEGFAITVLRRGFYAVVDALSEYPLPRQAGDFRLVSRAIVDELNRVEEPQPYLRGIIAGLGFDQIGIPYDREERKRGESKFSLRKLAGLAVDGILSTSVVPLRMATYLGLVVSVVTIATAVYFLVLALVYGRRGWPSGWASVAICVLFSMGLNALFLGIIGEYLGRLYKQSKNRSVTIIEQAIEHSGA